MERKKELNSERVKVMGNNNENNNQINTKDFLIGSLIGGIVGASIAMFLAPKSGKELRSDLSERATMVRDKTGEFTSTAIEKGSELAEVARDKTENLTRAVSEQSSALKNRVKSINQHKEIADENNVQEDDEKVSEENYLVTDR